MINLQRANTYTLMPMERGLKELRSMNKTIMPSKMKMEDVTTLFRAISTETVEELEDNWGDLRMKRTWEVVNSLKIDTLDHALNIVDEEDVAYVKTKAIIELLQEGSVSDKKAEQNGLSKILNQRSCLIICMYYGIGSVKMTHQDIADELDMSRDGIIRSLKRNMLKVQRYLDAI